MASTALPRFLQENDESNLTAHIGAEVTCTDGARYPLLANRRGYQNLCRMISRMKLRTSNIRNRGGKPRSLTTNWRNSPKA